MPYPKSWLKYGWYQLGVDDFAPVLIMAGLWLLVAAEVSVFHGSRARRGRGIAVAAPVVGWTLFAVRQAINATQIDIAGPHTRYPYYWACVLSSALVGAVVFATTVLADRLLAPSGRYRRPSVGVTTSAITAGVVWVAAWVAVHLREARLPASLS